MAETITDYIRSDLRTRIQSKDELHLDLTLAGLSERYRVSMTPVRLAVRDLLAEKVLVRQRNGQLAINRNSRKRPATDRPLNPLNPPPNLGDLEATFSAEVIRMSLCRDTAFLREEVTAERLGVGRAVLRQLLNRLQGKGLIEHLPRRGWRVRPFDEDDMVAFLEIRISLELKALDLAKPHLVREDLEAILRGNDFPADELESRLDNQLHRYLIEKSGNTYIRDFFDRHGIYFTLLFDYATPEAHVTNVMARQHRKILRALISRNWPLARKALTHHIRSQRPVLRRLMNVLEAESHAARSPTVIEAEDSTIPCHATRRRNS